MVSSLRGQYRFQIFEGKHLAIWDSNEVSRVFWFIQVTCYCKVSEMKGACHLALTVEVRHA
jgi:hypothetical protein